MENKGIKDNLLNHKEEFETVYGIISAHKKRAMKAIHNESLNMLWEVGAYVSDRLKKAVWDDGVVRMPALEQSRKSCHPKMVNLCHSKWHK